MSASAGRAYGGLSADERQAERRARLLDAGIEVIGTRGFAACTIRDFCRTARLNERYFYESFSGRDDFLLAVYERVVARVSTAVVDALGAEKADARARTRSAIGAFVGTLAADRRLARIQLFEVVGVNDALERRRREVIGMFASLVVGVAREVRPELERIDDDLARAASLMLVGGINELLIDWMLGRAAGDVDALIDQMVAVALALLDGLASNL